MTSLSIHPEMHASGDARAASRRCRARRLLGRHGRWHGPIWIGLAVVLYVGLISTQWHAFPDSARYLLLARSLNEGTGYAIHGVPHGKSPPGFPTYLAFMTRIGMGNMLVLNGMMVGMAIGSLLSGYALLRRQTTRRAALVSMLVVAFFYQMFRLAGAQLSDVPFFFMVTTALWLLLAGQSRVGPSMGLGVLLLIAACWTRVVGIPLGIAAAAGLVLQAKPAQRRRTLAHVAVLVMGILLTGITLYLRDRAVQAAAPQESYGIELAAVTTAWPWQWLGQAVRNLYLSGTELGRLLTGQPIPALVALPLFWVPVFIGTWRALQRHQYLATFAVWGYLGSIILLRVPLARYFLPVSPLLVLWMGQGIRWLWCVLGSRRWRPSQVAIAGAVLLMLANLPKDVRSVYRAHSPRRIVLEGNEDVYRVARYLHDAPTQEAHFASERFPGVISLLADRPYHVNTSRPLRPGTQPKMLRRILACDDIGYVVLWRPGARKTPPVVDDRESRLRAAGFHPAFQSGDVCVYYRAREDALIQDTVCR